MTSLFPPQLLSRREMLTRKGTGFGMLGLGSLLAAEQASTAAERNPLALLGTNEFSFVD